jgi:hypothetical protein
MHWMAMVRLSNPKIMVGSFGGLSLFNPIAYRIFEEKTAKFGRPKKFWSFALKTLGSNLKNQFLIFYTSLSQYSWKTLPYVKMFKTKPIQLGLELKISDITFLSPFDSKKYFVRFQNSTESKILLISTV